jgi:hypothetical protein
MVEHVTDVMEVDTPACIGGNGLQHCIGSSLEVLWANVEAKQKHSLNGSGGGVAEDLAMEAEYLKDIEAALDGGCVCVHPDDLDGVIDEEDDPTPIVVEVLEGLISTLEKGCESVQPVKSDGVIDEEDDPMPILVEVLEDLITKVSTEVPIEESDGRTPEAVVSNDDGFTLVVSGSYNGSSGKKGKPLNTDNPYDVLGWARFPTGDPAPVKDVIPTKVVAEESPQLDMLDMTPLCNFGGIEDVASGVEYQDFVAAVNYVSDVVCSWFTGSPQEPAPTSVSKNTVQRWRRRDERRIASAKERDDHLLLEEAIFANAGIPESDELTYSGLYCRGLYDGSLTSMVNLTRLFDVKRWHQHNRRMRLPRTHEWDVFFDPDLEQEPTITINEIWRNRFVSMPHWQEFSAYLRKLREARKRYLGVKIPERSVSMYSQLQAGDAEEQVRAKNEKANKRALLSELYTLYKESGVNGDVIKILTSLILLFRQRTIQDQALLLFLASMSIGTDRMPAKLHEYARKIEVFLREKVTALWKYVRTNFKSALRVDQNIASFFSGKQMQSGDPDAAQAGTFFDTMATWLRMINSFSEARFKDMMIVVGTLMSVSAAVTCGQCISTDSIIATVDGLVLTTTMPTQFQRLLKGIEHFSVLLAAGAKNGMQGITEWFKPAAQLSGVFERCARLKFLTPKLSNMNLGERAKFQDDLENLKRWYKDNKAWFESRAANQIYYLGKKDEIYKVTTEAQYALTEFQKRTMRIAPLCLGIYGGTAVAKTTLVRVISRIVMKAAGIDVDDESAPDRSYVFPPDGDFADGCSSAVQHVDLDDTGTLHSSIVTGKGGDKLIIALHRLVGNIPYFPNMAKLDDKGAVALHPVVVTASSNLEDFGAATTFVNDSIIGRRIDLTVEVRMNPKYNTSGNTADKPAMYAKNLEMIADECTDAPDFWQIRVWQYEATNVIHRQPGKMNKYEIRGELKQVYPKPKEDDETWCTADEFYYFLGKYAVNHFAQQHAYLTVAKNQKIDVNKYVPDGDKVFDPKGEVNAHALSQESAKKREEDEIQPVEESKPVDEEGDRIAAAAKKRVSQLPLFLNTLGYDTFNQWGVKVYRTFKQLLENPWPNYGKPLEAMPGPEPLGVTAPPQEKAEEFFDAQDDEEEEEDDDDDDRSPDLFPEMMMTGKLQAGDPETCPVDFNHTSMNLGGIDTFDAVPVDVTATVTFLSYLSSCYGSASSFTYETWAGLWGLVAFGTAVGNVANTGCAWMETLYSVVSWLIARPRHVVSGCWRSFKELLRDSIGRGAVFAVECQYNKIWKWAKANSKVIAMALTIVTLLTLILVGPPIVRAVKNRLKPKDEPELEPDAIKESETEIIMPTGGQQQSSDSLHENDKIAAYSDPGAPQVKPVPCKGVRMMPGENGVPSKKASVLFRRQVESNTWTCWLTHNGKPIRKTLASVFFVDDLTFVANEHVMQYRRLSGDVKLVLTHKWAGRERRSPVHFDDVPDNHYYDRRMEIPVRSIRWGTKAETPHAKSDLVVGRLLAAPLGPMMKCSGASDIPVVMYDMKDALPNETVANAVAGTQMAFKTGLGVYSGDLTYFKNEGSKALIGARVDIIPVYNSQVEDIGDTRPGDCGKVHFADNVSVGGKLYAFVLGIHTAIFRSPVTGERTIFTTPLSGVRTMIANLEERDEPFNNGMSETQNGDYYHNVKEADMVDVHPMSVVNWVYNPLDPNVGKVNEKVRVIGGYPGFRNTPTSKIRQGILWEHMDAKEITAITGKEFISGKVSPNFKEKVDNGCGGVVDPVRAAHFKALVPLATQPPRREWLYKRFQLVAKGLVKRYKQNPEWEAMLGKVSMDEAINGAPGQRAKNPLNWGTSAGFPYHHAKSALFELDEETGKRSPKPDLLKSVEALHEGLKKGTLHAVFSAQLKDEPVSVKKRLMGKYRVFMMAPVDATIVTRMYLLNFLRVMQLFPYTFNACVGMNSASEQWTQLGVHLGIGSDMCIFDGDYKDFDKSMTEEVTDVVRELIMELHKNAYPEQADLVTLENILKTTLSPVINFFGTFVKFPSQNPSGNSITTQVNCLVNAILVRYAWTVWYAEKKGMTFEDVAEEAGDVFDRDCRLATYGDDMVCAVKPEHSGFNCRTMHLKLKEIGIEFTDAAKNEGDMIQEFSAHEDITFLKRRFVSVDVEGFNFNKQYLAQLDYDSVVKMIEWTRQSTTHTDLDILKSTLGSVGTEAFGHGEELFNATRNGVREALERLGEKRAIKAAYYLFNDYEHYIQWYRAAVSVENGVYKEKWYAPPYPDDRVKRAPGLPQTTSLLPNRDGLTAGQGQGRWSSDTEPDRKSVLPAREIALANEQEEIKKKIAEAVCGHLQSGDMLTQFADSNSDPVDVEPKVTDVTFDDGVLGDYDLNSWFSRPTKLTEITWENGKSFRAYLNPWYDYFMKPDIREKLKGYSRLRCRMHVKVMINASPFDYGAGVMSYEPLIGVGSGDTGFSGQRCDFAYGTDPAVAVLTCRPHELFYAAHSRGCEMVLPFIYHKNWIELDELQSELQNMGALTVASLVKLRSATTVSDVNSTITVYAWAEDVEMTGPSYTLQSGDSVPPYGMASSMSGMVGAIGRRVAASLGQWRPNIIGNLANVEEDNQTEMLAVDQSNEVTLDSRTVGLDGVDHMSFSSMMDRNVMIMRFPWKSHTDPVDKLLYVKHVTPMVSWYRDATPVAGETFTTVTGLPVRAVQMTPSAHVGTAFANWRGSITYRFTVVASQMHRGRLMLTYDPAGHHKDYDEESYTDPRVITKIWDIQENPDFEFTVPYAAARPYLTTGLMANVFMAVPTIQWPSPPSTTDYKYDPNQYNGSIRISVLNPLITQIPNTEVEIMVRMNCSSLEFQNPAELDVPVSLYQLQSGECDALAAEPGDEVAPEQMEVMSKNYSISDVCMGEHITSLRQLLRRTMKYRTIQFVQFFQIPRTVTVGTSVQVLDPWLQKIEKGTAPPNAEYFRWLFLMPAMPLSGGALPHAIEDYTEGTIVEKAWAAANGNHDNQTERLTTYTNYFSPCYLGWRGSHVYKARLLAPTVAANEEYEIQEMSLSRTSYRPYAWFEKLYTHLPMLLRSFGTADESTSANAERRLSYKQNLIAGVFATSVNSGASGMTQTTPQQIPYTDAVIPYCAPFRMLPTNQLYNYEYAFTGSRTWDPLKTGGRLDQQNVGLNITIRRKEESNASYINAAPLVQLYHAAGADFTLFYYLNPPTYYVYTTANGKAIKGFATSC